MAATMLGPHSAARILAGATGLLALAMILSPFARRWEILRGHVVDCFAMGVGLVASIARHVDAAAPTHAHEAVVTLPAVALLALVAAGWAAARLAVLLAARTGRRTSLVGAALTAAGLALMLAMG